MKSLVIVLTVLLALGAQAGKHHKCMEEKKKMFECCKMPEFKDEKLTACQEKNKPEEGEKDEKKKWKNHACTAECFFKEKGALNEDGSMIKEKVVEMAEAGAGGDAEWTGVMKKSAETCMEKMQAMKAKMGDKKPPQDGDMKCKPSAMFTSFCIMGENVKNCPASKWNNSAECEAAKAKLETDECKGDKKED